MNPSDEKPDPELSALLGQLRVDAEDGGFEAQLARRLSAAAATQVGDTRSGLWQRLRSARRPAASNAGGSPAPFFMRSWFVGSTCGALSGVTAFLLMAQLNAAPPASEPLAVGQVRDALRDVPRDVEGAPLAAAARAHGGADNGSTAAPPACPPEVASSAEVVVLPAGKVALVQLQFDVPADVPEAEFSVLLPAGLSFFSEGEALGERSFHWVAPLAAGNNEIPVALVAEQPGHHRMTATASIDGQVVVHEIIFDVREQV